MQKTPEFHATYDSAATKSKEMQKNLQNFTQHMIRPCSYQIKRYTKKTLEFHASYDPIVTKSKGMQNSRISSNI